MSEPACTRHVHACGYGPARELTSWADRTVRSLFEAGPGSTGEDWSVVALGGYGRRELCPFSDLDILFLIGRSLPSDRVEQVLKDLLYPLWDAGFRAGYSVRTIPQVLHDAGRDFFLQTSLLGARLVCGSRTVFERLTSTLATNRRLNRSTRFISELAFHTRRRHELYGDASYVLEPDIKNGRGGLRDLQSIAWISSVLGRTRGRRILPACLEVTPGLSEAGRFLLEARFTLHLVAGRKTDRMHLEHQQALARRMGYTPKSSETAVEAFLRDFHIHAATVRSELETLLTYLNRPRGIRGLLSRGRRQGGILVRSGMISFEKPGELFHDPLAVMAAFRSIAREGSSLSPEARSRVRSPASGGIGPWGGPAVGSMLLEILRSPHAASALTAMLETGVLELLIPEYGAIRGRTIFDVFHTYTVDIHSIRTVSELRSLEEDEQEIFSRITDPDALYLGAFLHDIGKGIVAPHEVSGAPVAGRIASRLGFDDARSGLCAFLVENHLAMTELALGRDLTEEKVIEDFARRVSTPERLSMLFLLAAADACATGPLAWSDWKAALLHELYAKTLNLLERGLFRDPGNTRLLEERWRRLIDASRGDPAVSGRLWALPQAYVLATGVREIERHLAMSSDLTSAGDGWAHIRHEKSHAVATFVTRDKPGLFSLLAGLLAANRLEIIQAYIFTWYDGTVVDSFRVLAPWEDYRGWDDLGSQLKEILSGGADIEDRLARAVALRAREPSPPLSSSEAQASLDNESSDFFSIIDVRARRHRRLIYDVSRALSAARLDIHRAFITQSSDLVSCVFYVVDETGEKLPNCPGSRGVLEAVRTAAAGCGAPAPAGTGGGA
jgi:[protein-PII] uridylyltransferase